MKISVIHPSRGRPQKAYSTYERWVNNADHPFEYIMSWDEDDCRKYYEQFFYEDSNIKICLRPNHSAIEAINNAAKITTGDLFVVISDDFDCPAHWDTALLAEMHGKSDFVLKTRDGIQKTLVTLPIMDRKYYERFGYVFNLGYQHMYSDQELTAVAAMTGRLLYSDLLFPHNHYTTGKTVMDEVNKKNDATYPQGLAFFNERLAKNFDIVNPVIQYSEITWH